MQTEAQKRAKASYRDRNRESLRVKGRAYAEARRRAAGMPEQGSPESSAIRSAARKLTGPQHGMWKGEAASYSAVHHWINRWGVRTGHCSFCGGQNREGAFRKVRTDWANLSGRYLRDLSDWIELCTSCHKRFDSARKEVVPYVSENRD